MKAAAFWSIAIPAIALACLGIAWKTWPQPPTLPAYHSDQPDKGSYRAGGHKCEGAFLSSIRSRRQRLREEDTCAEKAEAERLQRNNLVQTARAADAAKAQALLAYQSGWNAFFQTLGGFLTLIAAGAAAWWARKAAIETERGASAAEDTTAETKRIGEATVRGYISITKTMVQVIAGDPVFTVFVKNMGQSPISNIRVQYQAVFYSPEGPVKKMTLGPVEPQNRMGGLSAGEEREIAGKRYPVGWDEAIHGMVRNSAIPVAIGARIKVVGDDVFGEETDDTAKLLTITNEDFSARTIVLNRSEDVGSLIGDEIRRRKDRQPKQE